MNKALDIVVVGGGMCGSLAAMLLAEQGHRVTVLERDSALPPDGAEQAWSDWERRSVRQFHLGHIFLPRFRTELAAHLPALLARIEAMGALEFNPIRSSPDGFTGGWRDGDERFTVLTARRPVMEAVVARAVAEHDNVTVNRGQAVSGLLVEPQVDGAQSAPVHVSGVTTEDGSEYHCDLLVDAGGRNSPLPRLLEEAGGRRPTDDSEDSGYIYYAGTYRAHGEPPASSSGGLQHYQSLSTLTLPADNSTWACGIVAAGNDKALRPLRKREVFERVWRSYPLVAHWLDGELLDEVKVMAGIEDRLRHYVTADGPVCTGVAAIGDAWACTNPSVGRGASIGMIHAVALRDQVAETDVEDRLGFMKSWHQRTEQTVRPWYDDTLVTDRHRLDQIAAEIAGTELNPSDPLLQLYDALCSVWFSDPELLRGYLDIFFVHRTKHEVFSDPEVVGRTMDLAAKPEAQNRLPGPNRQELLQLVGVD